MSAVKPKYKGIVKGGKFRAYDPLAFYREFYKREGKEVYVSVSSVRKTKSNNQNRYYRGVVLPILAEEFFGSDDKTSCDEMHSALGLLFRVQELPETGIKYIKSTANSKWTTVEWEDWIEQVRRWASAEYGIYIPEPNECTWV